MALPRRSGHSSAGPRERAGWHNPDQRKLSRTCLLSHVAALRSLHVAIAMFGFVGLFGKWLALSPIAIALGRTAIAAAALFIMRRWRRVDGPFDVRLAANGIVSGATFALLAVLNRRWATKRSAIDIAFWQNLVATRRSLPAVGGSRSIG